VANDVLAQLDGLMERYLIAGSLRRNTVMCHDVDLVVQPKPDALEVPNIFAVEPISPWDAKIRELIAESAKELKTKGRESGNKLKHGPAIAAFVRNDIPVDIYIGTPETYDGLVQIRTGSANFNTRLAVIAKSKNLQLHASGLGLQDLSNGNFIAKNEKDVITTLIGHYIEPENRN